MPRVDEVLVPLQRDLFSIGALLATPDPERMKEQLAKARIDETRIAELERAIDACDEELEPLRSFIILLRKLSNSAASLRYLSRSSVSSR